ncbi:MAG: cupin domain-containing protein [Promethearchaeota archaeon]
MKHYHYKERELKPVSLYNSKNTTIRILADADDVPNFIMRRFEIAPGGSIGVHSHLEEHEIYILEGEVVLIDDKGNRETVKKDEYVWIPPLESHGYLNEKDEHVVFICVIPKLKNNNKK